MKTFLKLLLLAGLLVYLCFAFLRFTGGRDKSRCTSVAMLVTDSAHAGFITEAEVRKILEKNRLYPVGREMDSIDSQLIETTLQKNPFISKAVCYKTPGGRVNVAVTQRLPLLRVMNAAGDDYYMDEKGYVMRPMNYVADIAVVTGHADRNFTRKYLVPIGMELRDNPFWDRQIEQINVTEDKEVELVPRVGDQIIHLGAPTDISKKLANLRKFYERVLPVVGWNKYSRIDLEFENQIICTKNQDT